MIQGVRSDQLSHLIQWEGRNLTKEATHSASVLWVQGAKTASKVHSRGTVQCTDEMSDYTLVNHPSTTLKITQIFIHRLPIFLCPATQIGRRAIFQRISPAAAAGAGFLSRDGAASGSSHHPFKTNYLPEPPYITPSPGSPFTSLRFQDIVDWNFWRAEEDAQPTYVVFCAAPPATACIYCHRPDWLDWWPLQTLGRSIMLENY